MGPTFPIVTNLGTAANGHPVSYWNRSFFGLNESFFLTILILKKQGTLSITPEEIASTTTPEKFNISTTTNHFEFLSNKSRDYRDAIVIKKLPFQNVSVHTKT